jgi:hypothetical protein
VQWNLVEILAIDHQEHRDGKVVATHLVQDGLRWPLVSFMAEVPVDNEATERGVRGNERGGVTSRGGTNYLMSKRSELGHDTAQRLAGETFALWSCDDEDWKCGTAEHVSVGHRDAPPTDDVAMANSRSH